MKKKTKVQTVSGSLTTTIPVFVRDVLSLEKGNTIEWIINTKTEEIKIRKVENG